MYGDFSAILYIDTVVVCVVQRVVTRKSYKRAGFVCEVAATLPG
jgi:hypothetical protein